MTQQITESPERTGETEQDETSLVETNVPEAVEQSLLSKFEERVMSSGILTPKETLEIMETARKVHPPEMLETWFKSFVGEEKYEILFPKINPVETNGKIPKTEPGHQERKDSEPTKDSIWKSWLQTIEKLILWGRDMFPDDSKDRLAYVRYILTALVLVLGLWAWYAFFDKHPEAASVTKGSIQESKKPVAEVMEGSVSIQGQSASGNITQSFTVSNNHIVSNGVGQKELSSIDGRLDKFENSLEAIYAFMQKNTAIPNADAAEADVTMERQVRDTAFEIKDAVAELKKSPEITAEQEKRIDALNETVEKVIGRLKNSPTATLNEIAHISKTQSGSYAFRTLYDQDKVDFTTRTVSGGTLLSIVSPIKKDYLLTCRNLVPGKGEMWDYATVYVGDSCTDKDARYIQPLFITKNFELYWLSKNDTEKVESLYILYHGQWDSTKVNSCNEQNCVWYGNFTIRFPMVGHRIPKELVYIDALTGKITYPKR